MPKCIIVCASDVELRDWEQAQVSEGDLIIAADMGYLRLQALGVEPHMIVGDFDSAPPPQETKARVEAYSSHKDDTDCLIAVRRGWESGFHDFVILGALGGKRLDHTIANLQTLDYIARLGGSARMISQGTHVQIIRNGSLRVKRTKGKISVFSLGESSSGVYVKGVDYPLENHVLTCGYPLGVSNSFAAEYAEISVALGSLLVIWTEEAQG